MKSDVVEANDNLAALERRRADLTKQVLAAQGEMTASKAAFGGGVRLPRAEYQRLNERRVAATRKLQAAQGELADVNAQLKDANRKANQKEHVRWLADQRRGYVDEFDLGNQLVEPQTLLQQALVALERATARSGRTESDRAVIDSIRDYLRRHGIAI